MIDVVVVFPVSSESERAFVVFCERKAALQGAGYGAITGRAAGKLLLHCFSFRRPINRGLYFLPLNAGRSFTGS